MTRRPDPKTSAFLPTSARWLGAAGLIPPMLLLAVLLIGPSAFRPAAIYLALSYSALILSFIGGTWWGLAAQTNLRASPWIWLVAIAPSLIAFVAVGVWVMGKAPGPSLWVLGGSLIGALGVDLMLAGNGLCPPGWLRLRTPLSIGLGGITIVVAILSG